MKILTSTICKQGGRQYNQDYVAAFISGNSACLVACDGLGSYIGSEVASRLCAEKIIDCYKQSLKTDPKCASTIESALIYIRSAHNFVVDYKEKTPAIKSSCTTVACVFTDGVTTTIANIGDTRIYMFKSCKLSFQSKDHSLSQVAVDSGKIALRDVRNHIDQNKLTRVLGSDYFAEPDCANVYEPLQKGDAFIVCTDGFWEFVYEEEMEADLKSSLTPSEALAKMEQRLNARATKFNDNYSAIVAMIE